MTGKQKVAHFPSLSLSNTSHVLEVVHTDVMRPMKTKSKGGANMSWYKKTEVPAKFQAFKAMYENQWNQGYLRLCEDITLWIQ
ncbi:polyprotein [Phytophthora megakarya]|uniref:Polyprotein n=1 Tax=Phytophthora megakarya TaxID=4795 RepID=A0A225VRA2_9STRA|nr:polyprotein [Phytophthora megakarya]